ncbi:MAG: hypothetical protein D6693_03725 [Planctomycetota bacterium]|nr:MAG: hypothetical protein D6693_03725 [Planctomycetota bacterium]
MVATLGSLLSPRSRTQPIGPAPDPERDRLVDDIRSLNPTATRDFLAEFRPAALRLYLAHLAATRDEPRGPGAVWVRPADTPAIVTRAARE